MPSPVSATLTTTRVRSVVVVTVTMPPAGVWRSALLSRLSRISRSRSGSARTSGGGPVLQPDALDMEGLGCGPGRLGHDLVDIRRPSADLKWPFLGTGDAVHVLHQPAQAGGLLPHGLPGVVAGRDDIVFDTFEETVQGGDGRAQLMSEVGEQLASAAFGALQRSGHPVERV